MYVAMHLFRNRQQMTSRCGKEFEKDVTQESSPVFSPHFDVFCGLLLNRRTATWNLSVLYDKERKHVNEVICTSFLE